MDCSAGVSLMPPSKRNNTRKYVVQRVGMGAPTGGPFSRPYTAVRRAPVQETRAALGVRLEGSILIVDEAHNLVDAVNGAHSATLTTCHVRAAQGQLDRYYECFRSRLSPGE